MTENPHDEIMELEGLHPGADGEVSAVNVGANPGAHILLLKARHVARDKRTDDRAIVLAGGHVATSDRDHEEASVPKGTETTSAGAGNAPATKQELLLKLDPEQRKEFETLIKSAAEAAAAPLAAKIEALEKQNAELQAAQAKDAELEAFAASLPEAMRAAFLGLAPEEQAAFMSQHAAMAAAGAADPLAKFAKSFDEQAKKIADQEKQLAKMRDDQEQAAAVAKFGPLVGRVVKPEEFARHYRAIAKTDQAAADFMAEKLAAFAAQDKGSKLFSVIGGDGDSAAKSAREEIERKAAEIRKADPSLTMPQAIRKAVKDNPDLRLRELEEKSA